MRVCDFTTRVSGGTVRYIATIERCDTGKTVELFYEFSEEWAPFVFDGGADPAVAAIVIPTMMMPVERLHIEPPVSVRLLEGAQTYIDAASLMRAEEMHRIELTASQPVVRPDAPAANVGAFLSLGVDSFNTLLTNVRGLQTRAPRITHLIHMRGFQEPLSREHGNEETECLIREVASEVGLPVIFGRTNLRDLFTAPKWARHHGAGLASVGLTLQKGIGRLLTPSAHSYAYWRGIGCHPLIDPLWSSEQLRMSVDGAERSRRDKIVEVVGPDPLAQKYLRVCLKNHGAAHNCGRCQKCIRTMLILHMMGTLDRVETFPDAVTPEVMHLLAIRNNSEYTHALEIFEYAQEVGTEPWMMRRLRKIIRRHEIRQAMETICANPSGRFLLNRFDGARRLLNLLRGRRMPRRPKATPPRDATPGAAPRRQEA